MSVAIKKKKKKHQIHFFKNQFDDHSSIINSFWRWKYYKNILIEGSPNYKKSQKYKVILRKESLTLSSAKSDEPGSTHIQYHTGMLKIHIFSFSMK